MCHNITFNYHDLLRRDLEIDLSYETLAMRLAVRLVECDVPRFPNV